jgi:hypothetical protein
MKRIDFEPYLDKEITVAVPHINIPDRLWLYRGKLIRINEDSITLKGVISEITMTFDQVKQLSTDLRWIPKKLCELTPTLPSEEIDAK